MPPSNNSVGPALLDVHLEFTSGRVELKLTLLKSTAGAERLCDAIKAADAIMSSCTLLSTAEGRAEYGEAVRLIAAVLRGWSARRRHDPRWRSLLEMKGLQHEAEEAIVPLATLLRWLSDHSPQGDGGSTAAPTYTLADMCCGKGIFSLLLSHAAALQPKLRMVGHILMIDRATRAQVDWTMVDDCIADVCANRQGDAGAPAGFSGAQYSSSAATAASVSCTNSRTVCGPCEKRPKEGKEDEAHTTADLQTSTACTSALAPDSLALISERAEAVAAGAGDSAACATSSTLCGPYEKAPPMDGVSAASPLPIIPSILKRAGAAGAGTADAAACARSGALCGSCETRPMDDGPAASPLPIIPPLGGESALAALPVIPLELWSGCNVHEQGEKIEERLRSFSGQVIVLGIHLCRRLSPSAVSLYNRLGREKAPLLMLAPCCLPRLTGPSIAVGCYEMAEERQARLDATRRRWLIKRGRRLCWGCLREGHMAVECPLLAQDLPAGITHSITSSTVAGPSPAAIASPSSLREGHMAVECPVLAQGPFSIARSALQGPSPAVVPAPSPMSPSSTSPLHADGPSTAAVGAPSSKHPSAPSSSQSVPGACWRCGRFGHHKSACPAAAGDARPSVGETHGATCEIDVNAVGAATDKFGAWVEALLCAVEAEKGEKEARHLPLDMPVSEPGVGGTMEAAGGTAMVGAKMVAAGGAAGLQHGAAYSEVAALSCEGIKQRKEKRKNGSARAGKAGRGASGTAAGDSAARADDDAIAGGAAALRDDFGSGGLSKKKKASARVGRAGLRASGTAAGDSAAQGDDDVIAGCEGGEDPNWNRHRKCHWIIARRESTVNVAARGNLGGTAAREHPVHHRPFPASSANGTKSRLGSSADAAHDEGAGKAGNGFGAISDNSVAAAAASSAGELVVGAVVTVGGAAAGAVSELVVEGVVAAGRMFPTLTAAALVFGATHRSSL